MSTYIVNNYTDTPVIGQLSLREAVALANANPGSTINFSVNGTVNITQSEIVVTQPVTIAGLGAANLTIQRSAVAQFNLFTIQVPAATTVTISDVTLSNGASNVNGGCIYFNSPASAIFNLTNCIVSNNTNSVSGGCGAIFCRSQLFVNGCAFNGNTTTGNAQQSCIIAIQAAQINNTTFTSNSSITGGCILVANGLGSFSNNTFTSNNAATGASTQGSIITLLTGGTITSNIFNNNIWGVVNSGCIATQGATSTITVTSCSFTGNTGAGLNPSGSCIHSIDSSYVITNSNFTSNTTSGNAPNSIFIVANTGVTATADLNNNMFTNNTNTGFYCVLLSGLASNNVSQCTFQNNNSGGLQLLDGPGTVNLCQFIGNTAILTAGMTTGSTTSSINIVVDVTNTTFQNNTSTDPVTSLGCDFLGGVATGSTVEVGIYNCTFSGATANTTNGCSMRLDAPRIRFFNSTVTGVTGNRAMYILNATGTSNKQLINSTINTNNCIAIDVVSPAILNVGNTVVANSTVALVTVPDFTATSNGNVVSLGNNLIGDADGMGTTFTQPGDQTGTTIAPLNPNLGPLANNGGPTLTMLPIVGSPLINAGSNAIVSTYFVNPALFNAGNPIDQRGFLRIFAGQVDIGSTEFGSVVCFIGDSEILVKNIVTGSIERVTADRVYSDRHQVYDVVSKTFHPIIYNIVAGNNHRFIKFSCNSISENIPYQDFYVTSGHQLLINGAKVKARDATQGVVVRIKSQPVYSICTEQEIVMDINGMLVMSWPLEKFQDFCKHNHLSWMDNCKQCGAF